MREKVIGEHLDDARLLFWHPWAFVACMLVHMYTDAAWASNLVLFYCWALIAGVGWCLLMMDEGERRAVRSIVIRKIELRVLLAGQYSLLILVVGAGWFMTGGCFLILMVGARVMWFEIQNQKDGGDGDS